jgi:putative SOS response-associated peptidase YedK
VQALALLKPYPAEGMRAYPVSGKVNSPKNDASELVEPVPE